MRYMTSTKIPRLMKYRSRLQIEMLQSIQFATALISAFRRKGALSANEFGDMTDDALTALEP